MKLVKPMNEDKKEQLERELEFQKQRFIRATRQTKETLKTDLNIRNWIREFPLQSAAICFISGYMVTRLIPQTRDFSPPSIPEDIF